MANFWSDLELQQPAWLHRHWLAQLWGIHNTYAQGRDPASVGRILPSVTVYGVDDHCVVMDWKVAKQELMSCAHQMMFVSGETAEPSTETTGLIEEIVRAQVIDMVRLLYLGTKLAEANTWNLAGQRYRPCQSPRCQINLYSRPNLPHPP